MSTPALATRGLSRLGTAIFGIATDLVLQSHAASAVTGPVGADCPVPTGCTGPAGCCTCSGGETCCCWAYVDVHLCKTYKCCDRPNDVSCSSGVLCICRYLTCNCC